MQEDVSRSNWQRWATFAGVGYVVLFVAAFSLGIEVGPSAFAATDDAFTLDPNTRRLFEDAGLLLFASGAIAAILLVVAVSVATLRFGVLPRWLDWASSRLRYYCRPRSGSSGLWRSGRGSWQSALYSPSTAPVRWPSTTRHRSAARERAPSAVSHTTAVRVPWRSTTSGRDTHAGDCQHPVVDAGNGFAGTTGQLTMKDRLGACGTLRTTYSGHLAIPAV